ncbi:reverse transcriptase domain-containing protein, partial [Tanacetum coccineum]
PSDDDKDEEVDIKADDEEEEEHPAPADSTDVALPVVDQAPSAKETELFETDESAATPPPHPAYRITARISIRDETPISLTPREEIPSPPLPQISSPLLPVSSPVRVLSPSLPAIPICPLVYQAAMIWLRAEAASTSHSLPSPPPIILSHTRPDATSSRTPPFHLLSTNHRADRPEVTLLPRKRFGIALGPRYEVGESSSTAAARPTGGLRADYGFVATMDKEISQRMTEFETRVRQDTDEIYTRLDDEQSKRQLMAGRLNMLYMDRRYVVTYLGGSTAGSDYRATGSRPQEAGGDYRDAGCRSQEAKSVHRGTEAVEETSSLDDRAMIDQGVTAVLAARDANKNGVDSHNSGTCARRNERATSIVLWKTKSSSPLTELKKKMTDKYCPRTDIKKLKVKLWELKVKGTDVIGYNQRFQELALQYGRMFPEESDKIEKYVGGLPDMIHGSVVASNPKTMQEATEMEIEVMDKRIRTFANRQIENKRKQDNNQQLQQKHQNKRQNTGRAYAARTVEKKQYGGSKPLCSKCNYHHDGPCAPKCHKCNKVGHFARDCRSTTSANNAMSVEFKDILRGNVQS